MGSRQWRVQVGAVLACALAACTRGGGGPADGALGPVERLNVEEGLLARFTFPYYTAIQALPGGGAIAVWMSQEPPFRPLVYRFARDRASGFGEQHYLGTPGVRETISVVPSLALGPDDDTVYAVWQARIPSSGDKAVIFRRSDDGGESWTEEHDLTSQPTAFVPAMATDADGGLYVVWTDERQHKRRVFFNRSLDRGRTWLEHDLPLTDRDPPDGEVGDAVGTAIATDGEGGLVVVWEAQRKRGRVVGSIASRDRGATWEPIAQVDAGGPGRYSPSGPRVVFAGERAVVAWTESATNAVARVWSDVSDDGGRTWRAEDVLVHETERGIPSNIDLVSDGTTAHLALSAGPFTGNWQIYHTRTGGDDVWEAAGDALEPVSAGEAKFANPRLAVDGARAALTYAADRRQVVFSDSADGGATWSPPRTLYEIAAEQGGATARYPQVSVMDDLAWVLWEVWGDRAGAYKTLADGDEKVVPADLFTRRVTLAR